MGLSFWHILLLLGVVVVLFGGGGKISGIMGDVAKGIKSFKKGMADDDEAPAPKAIERDARGSTTSAQSEKV